MKLDEIIKQYIDDMQFSVKTHTYLYYQNVYKIYIKNQFDIHIKSLTTEHLNQKLANMLSQYSVSTVRMVKSLIQRAQSYAKQKKYIKEDVPISLKLKQTKTQNKCLTTKN